MLPYVSQQCYQGVRTYFVIYIYSVANGRALPTAFKPKSNINLRAFFIRSCLNDIAGRAGHYCPQSTSVIASLSVKCQSNRIK